MVRPVRRGYKYVIDWGNVMILKYYQYPMIYVRMSIQGNNTSIKQMQSYYVRFHLVSLIYIYIYCCPWNVLTIIVCVFFLIVCFKITINITTTTGLPDAASEEAASWVDNDTTVIIDASTAFRINDDWVYGFPELSKEQRTKLSTAKRISNPGCYPTGFIGLTRPLTDAGILPVGTPVTVNAISGYSGGGKALMGIYENEEHEPWGAYGLNLKHKHVPEMAKYSGLLKGPIFQPAVATFPQGMVVSVPLHYEWLQDGTTGSKIHEVYKKHYENSKFVEVMPLGVEGVQDQLVRGAFLPPDTLKDTNKLQIFVFPNDSDGQVLLMARLDNLGKGASGAAVQNLNIALGLDETTGLM